MSDDDDGTIVAASYADLFSSGPTNGVSGPNGGLRRPQRPSWQKQLSHLLRGRLPRSGRRSSADLADEEASGHFG
eukprot:5612963-Prymnesium_polylepis.1